MTAHPARARLACAWAFASLATPMALAQSTAPATSASTQSLPEVTVSASDSSAESLPAPYAGGQVAKGARLGVLGNVDVMDTPFNITSFTSEVIENQSARTIGDVLLNDPSVRTTTSAGHAYENFRIRGFDVGQNDTAINGMFGLTPVGHTPIEMFERVELLKGPNALFNGMSPSGTVGGAINLVPKRAGDEALNRVSIGGQTSGLIGTTFDLGRRLGKAKDWGLRINGSFSDGDTEIDGQSKRRDFLSAALDYRSAGLKASLDAYTSTEEFKGGTPAMFWMGGTRVVAAPKGSVNQLPGARGELESKAVIARAEYAFNHQFSAFAGVGVRKHDYNGYINGTHVRSIDNNGSSKQTYTVATRGYDDAVSSEAGLRAEFATGSVAHDLVLQASHLSIESGAASKMSSPFTTSIYHPVYQGMPEMPGSAPKTAENTLASVALVDNVSLMQDMLRITLGLRHQSIQTTNYNASTGALSGKKYDKSAVTPAVGVVLKPWGPDISLYANYVQGLSKGDTISIPTYVRDYTFAPYKTKQKEIGVKWNAGTFTHTASVFEITRPMLISIATASGNDATDGGEKRVRGVEWNTFGEVTRGVRLLGGASWTQGVQTKTAGGTFKGFAAVGAPRWQGNLGAEWDTPLKGLTVSGRVIANSSQYLNAANTLELPGWSDVQLGARYATQIAGRNTVLRLNVANVFDRAYYSGAFSDTTPIATQGAPRTVSLSATVDF